MPPHISRKALPNPSPRFAIKAGVLWRAGLTLPDFLSWQAPAAAVEQTASKAKAVSLLYMTGGPAQQETFDMKPAATSGYRAEFRPIATSFPGIQVCELLPFLARTAHRYSIIRSVWHEPNGQGIGAHSNLTGIDLERKQNVDAKTARRFSPCFGSVVQYLDGGRNGLPASVQLPNRIGDQNAFSWPGQTASHLGSRHNPLTLIDESWQPQATLPNFSPPDDVTPQRLAQRTGLLQEQPSLGLKNQAATRDLSRFQLQAIDILNSRAAWKAFDIKQERPQMLACYGDNRFGRSVLVARRLVEAGVRVVTVTWMRNHSTENFDTHRNHFRLMKELLLPPVDFAFSALLEDLDDRGILDSTLVAWTGEFGRTPKINGNAGRDHSASVYSTVLAGGGIRDGRVIGSTDKIAGEPVSDAHHVSDFFATMYQALGYRSDVHIIDVTNQPHFIVQDQPIQQLF